MRQLLPLARDARLDDLYAGLTLPVASSTDCWVAVGMISSLDGAASHEGRSGALGDEADRLAISRLRDATDAVLVGAATVRAEGYGPLTATATRRADRRARGLAEIPRLAILTASGRLAAEAGVFSDPRQRPLVLTTTTGARRATATLGERAEVVALGDDVVAPRTALAALAERGLGRVLCEGGPRVTAQLLGEDLVDEMFLTHAPVVVAGDEARIAQSAGTRVLRRQRLVSVWEHDGALFLRYRHPRHEPV